MQWSKISKTIITEATFFYLGFLSWTFTIHRTTGERGVYIINSSLGKNFFEQMIYGKVILNLRLMIRSCQDHFKICVMFSFPYVDSDLGRYFIWKVNTRIRGINLKNTLCITLSYFLGSRPLSFSIRIIYLLQHLLM